MSQELTKANAVAVQRKDSRALLESSAFRNKVAQVLPRHIGSDRFIRLALGALSKPPAYAGATCLADCEPQGLMLALLDVARLGLEPGGPQPRVHLIPFRNKKRNIVECQLIVDYKGLIELAMRSGMVSSIHADVICENDEFDYDIGQIVHHRINFREPRGKHYAAYAIARMKDGSTATVVLNREDIQRIKASSRASGDGPWVTNEIEMWKKSAVRRLSKFLPLSDEWRDALAKDADETEEPAAKADFDIALPEAHPTALPATSETESVDVESDHVEESTEPLADGQIQELYGLANKAQMDLSKPPEQMTIAEFHAERKALAEVIQNQANEVENNLPPASPKPLFRGAKK